MKFKIVRRGDSWKVKTTAIAPLRDYEEDEKCAAEALLMLANSGSGFLTLSSSTTTTAEKSQDPPSTIPAPPAQKEMSYTCNVCGKTFGLYQALGGHKTSHRPAPAAADADSCGGVHECSVCHESFPSGQALGGHMSKHLERRKSTGAAACKRRRVTSSGGCPDAVRVRVFVRDFDLNELPAPEPFSGEEVIEL